MTTANRKCRNLNGRVRFLTRNHVGHIQLVFLDSKYQLSDGNQRDDEFSIAPVHVVKDVLCGIPQTR